MRPKLIIGIGVAIALCLVLECIETHFAIVKLDAAIETARAEQLVNATYESTDWMEKGR